MSAVPRSFPDGVPAEPVPLATTEVRGRAGAGPVVVIGLLTILVAAWGGIAPYAGPAFGFDPTTTTAWSWTLAHALLALAPGAVGVLAGISMLTTSSRLTLGIGRFSLIVSGTLALLVGAWFVIGPSAWPVLRPVSGYLLPGGALHLLVARIGVAFGPGLVLAGLGAAMIGWAVRHRPPAVVVRPAHMALRPTRPAGSTRLAPVAAPPVAEGPTTGVPAGGPMPGTVE